MADNYEKLALQNSLNRIAINRAADAIQIQGRALPCRVVAIAGSIVTVAFEVNAGAQTLPNITIPKNESQWLRAPTQIGDFGVTQPADVYLGGISGQGGGVARLNQVRGNLATLMFTPCASTAFGAAPDLNKAWVNGPAGAVISTTDNAASITVAEGVITIAAGGKVWTFSAAGFTMADGVVGELHQHSYLPGTGAATLTGAPVA